MRAAGFALEGLVQDVRYGARLLRRSPWFTLVGILSLAVGLGAGVALFTFMNALLFRPLPGRGTADLHAIYTSNSNGGRYGGTSFADFQSFAATPGLFTASCATTNARGNLALRGRPEPVAGAVITGGCFEALDLRPHLGRLLNESDDHPTSESSAIVISHALWVRAFDSDPGIIGSVTLLNGTSVVIAGITEPGFAGTSLDSGAEFFAPPQLAPVLLSPDALTARGDRRFRVYVRLQDGLSASQAAQRLAGVAAGLQSEDPRAWTERSGARRSVTILPELQARFASSHGAAEAIGAGTIGAIVVIIAMACVNLATMVMARGVSRTHELSVRLAVGASRGRLLRQLTTESLLISAAGTVAAVLMVGAALQIFNAYRPADVPAFNLALDWRVAAFALLAALVSPLLFGLAPGAHALRLAIAEGIKGRQLLVRRRYFRLGMRELLIVVQVLTSFALLVIAALFMRSLSSAVPAGEADVAKGVAVVQVEMNTARGTDAEVRDVAQRLLQAASRVPDVENPTAAALVPLTGSYLGIAGRTGGPESPRIVFDANIVAPGYFELLGIGVRAGRTFDVRDHDRAPRVAVVSESLARRMWGGEPAVGRTVQLEKSAAEVVGIVADVPYRSASEPSQPVLYVPFAQMPHHRLVIHARIRNEGEAIVALDRALSEVDPRALVASAMPLSGLFEQTRIAGKITQWVGAAAGLLQLGLALMATWGLVAYAVERRRSEIAIRRALGATEGNILQLVMRPSLWLLAAGAVLGSTVGIVAAKVLYSAFLGLAPLDLTVVLPAASLVAAVVIAGAWLPARRAVSIEPAAALKDS